MEVFQEICRRQHLWLCRHPSGDYSLQPHQRREDGVSLHYSMFRDGAESDMRFKPFIDALSRDSLDCIYAEALVRIYEHDRSAISFRNGVLFLETGKFQLHELLPEMTTARQGFGDLELNPFDALLPTPKLDALLCDPSPSTYAKIGCAYRTRKMTGRGPLFIIGDSYDARVEIRRAIERSSHFYDFGLLDHRDEKCIRSHKQGSYEFLGNDASCISYINFEHSQIPLAVMNMIAVAEGKAMPRPKNLDPKSDIVNIRTGGYDCNFNYRSEYPNFILKCIRCSHAANNMSAPVILPTRVRKRKERSDNLDVADLMCDETL